MLNVLRGQNRLVLGGSLHWIFHTWLTGMKITPKEDGTFAYERYNIWTKERGGAQNRDLLLPLPQDEVNRMEAVTGDKWQNPGW